MSSVNLTVAFLVTQLALFLIVFVGLGILRHGESRMTEHSILNNYRPTTPTHIYVFAGVMLTSIALFAFCEDMLGFSRPVFGGIEFPSITRSTTFLVLFLVDLVAAAWLIVATGGSKDSPFSPILFMLPSLAIFLRESPQRFIWYTILAATLFLVALPLGLFGFRTKFNPQYLAAFIFVTLSCLLLSSFVGYVTRPV